MTLAIPKFFILVPALVAVITTAILTFSTVFGDELTEGVRKQTMYNQRMPLWQG